MFMLVWAKDPLKLYLLSLKYPLPLDNIPWGWLQMATRYSDILKNEKYQTEADVVPEIVINPSSRVEDLPPVQESDLMKEFLLEIGDYGLDYVYHKYGYPGKDVNPDDYKFGKTKHPIKIIIVGAGPSGLAAAFELSRVGHHVTILEMQHRVGGRVKTMSDGHFYKGLWSDSGAMRLPGTGAKDWKGPSHFMTDFYAQKFNLPRMEFVNETPNGYYFFFGKPPIKMSEWDKDPDKYTSEFWPGWDKRLLEVDSTKVGIRKQVNGISDYFTKSTDPVVLQLYKWLAATKHRAEAWQRWIDRWSQFSWNDFLISTYDEIILKISRNEELSESDKADLAPLADLLPWPVEAIVAYTTFSYTVGNNISLVEYLRDYIGQWWKEPMHTYTEGLSMLPWSFLTPHDEFGGNSKVDLSQNIIFGVRVQEIKYSPGSVTVVCKNTQTGMFESLTEFEADKVMVTLPLNIIRQLEFQPPLPNVYYDSFASVNYSPSTKIMLQCRHRFWEEEAIQGGFSKTNMPIGQLHYPSNPGFKIPKEERGILMCYTWKQEALLFGSQSSDHAIQEAVEEVSKLHPQMRNEFEVGAIQSWYDDPAAQGGFAMLEPMQRLALNVLKDPYMSVYFCGEAISTANGWIQGALESGLYAAYRLYAENEKIFDIGG